MQESLPQILTVSELNKNIKDVVEQNFRYVNIIGEISNFKAHTASGHFYFTLKDEDSQISAVMWRNRAESLIYSPEDGLKVLVTGRVTLFAARGTYQLEVWEMKPRGIGEMQLRFEQLKQKLMEEGLFDAEHKKSLPKYPQNIAILTSRTGAVIHDFIKVSKRRYPLFNLYLCPVNVQGDDAATSIIGALKGIQKISGTKLLPDIDIIVIARGGGSLEDLMPFNDEKLARAIFTCKIPVVSAVGHEVDFTICDFVSDLRAPTPSAAAELITPNIKDFIDTIDNFSYFSRTFVQTRLDTLKSSLRNIETSYYFNRPKDIIHDYYQQLDDYSTQLNDCAKEKIKYYKQTISHYKKTLHHINPEVNLKKGYAIVNKKIESDSLFDETKIVTRASQLKKEDEVDIKFYDNKKKARISS
ncbi:MAG TPA: exodeoxyribonuclease VII large subunit [Ignavibacteria bacterium]|nr:exodeoxyribonuclease VII large subunit [Ignavibacteria bacterium]